MCNACILKHYSSFIPRLINREMYLQFSFTNLKQLVSFSRKENIFLHARISQNL